MGSNPTRMPAKGPDDLHAVRRRLPQPEGVPRTYCCIISTPHEVTLVGNGARYEVNLDATI